jgi:hypothetical protein
MRERMELTIRLLNIPSSTTCVATILFANSAQKVATTIPAWTAIRTANATDPYSKIDPVVKGWSGRVRR